MTSQIKVGDNEYRKLVSRMNQLERLCDQRLLTVPEQVEYRDGRAQLEQAELQHSIANAGAHT